MPPARELVITYGSYSCSPDGHYSLSETFDTFSLQFTILITATTESAFATAISDAITAFRKPFQNLTVVQGSQTLFSISQSGNTGLEVRSEIIKQEHDADTGRSIRLTIRIVAGLPAGNVATVGLREFSVNVDYSPSRRRTVTLGGVWTASGGSSARTLYDGGIAAVAATTKTALGITNWEVVGKPRTESSYHDQTISFSITYKEILFGQIGSGDDSAVVDQHLRISVSTTSVRMAPGGGNTPEPGSTTALFSGGNSRPFIAIDASFDCFVDFDVTTDLASIWRRVKTWVVPLMKTASGSGVFALTDDNPQYDYDDNHIVGQLRGVALPSGVSSIAREYSVTETDEKGVVLIPVWDENKAYSKFRYLGPGQKIQTTRSMEETVSGGGSSNMAVAGGGGGGGISMVRGFATIGNSWNFGQQLFGPGSESAGYLIGEIGYGRSPKFNVPGFGQTPDGGKKAVANAAAQQSRKSNALIRTESGTEPFVIGLPDGGATISINRVTTTTVIEFFDEVR